MDFEPPRPFLSLKVHAFTSFKRPKRTYHCGDIVVSIKGIVVAAAAVVMTTAGTSTVYKANFRYFKRFFRY
jgi:hypothetical protein